MRITQFHFFALSFFLFTDLYGSNNYDKLFLTNSNSYHGTFIKAIDNQIFFKINDNNEIDSVKITSIQLLQLSSGNKIIENGIVVGKVKITDLAKRNVRLELGDSFKWKAIGIVSVPLSLFSASLFWNLSKRFTSSNNGLPPALFLGFSSVFSFQFTLSNTNVMVKGMPKGINSMAKKAYEQSYSKELKKQRKILLSRGIFIGSIGSAMLTYLSKNVTVI